MAHLTLIQRYKIEANQGAGKSISEIAELVNKHKSVISRELKRNADERSGVYKADLAQRKAELRSKTKAKRNDLNTLVESNIIYYLTKDFSPEQIVGKAKLDGREMVSIQRIYDYIRDDKKRGGKLYQHLRTKGKKYAKRGLLKSSRGVIPDRVGIEKRPSVVDKKERFGDLEIDLIIGKRHKEALLTINDRATGFLIMGKVESKEAHLIEAWIPLIFTITSDNGKEFANHKDIANQLDINFYFARPYHSWERGANENLNGLVRQYFPKGSSFTNVTKEQITQVVNILNNRPRKRFGYKTPNEILAQKLDNFDPVAFVS